MTIVLDEAEKVYRFVIALTFSIKSYTSKAAREGVSFRSIVSTAKEVKLMNREEFGDPKKAFSGTLSGGRSSHRGGRSFRLRGPIHA